MRSQIRPNKYKVNDSKKTELLVNTPSIYQKIEQTKHQDPHDGLINHSIPSLRRTLPSTIFTLAYNNGSLNTESLPILIRLREVHNFICNEAILQRGESVWDPKVKDRREDANTHLPRERGKEGEGEEKEKWKKVTVQ